jgi:DNA-binding transcriptional MerR regulator
MNSVFLHRNLIKIFPYVKPRTIISWTERGLLKPDYEDASGKGSSRRYSYRNLLEIAFISELFSYGLPFSMVKNIVDSTQYKEVISSENQEKVLWVEQTVGNLSIKSLLNSRFKHQGDQLIQNTGSAIILNINVLSKKIEKKVRELDL